MIKLSPYLDALRQMETQFEFLRYAMENLSPSSKTKFFEMKLRAEQSKKEADFNRVSQLGIDPRYVEMAKQRSIRKLKKTWGRETRKLYQEQFVPDDLNKSELLLLVALFEGYMADFYGELIKAEPRRAFAKSERKESLREVFADNAGEWTKSAFFGKVLDEEVDRFDHTPFKGRMDFMLQSYDFRVNQKDLSTAHEFIERRHKISHRWTDRNALKHVSPQDIIDARRIFRLLPESLFSQAEKRYPGNFARS